MTAIKSAVVTNESITVIWEGKLHTVKSGSPNYAGLKKALAEEDEGSISKYLTVSFSLEKWAKGNFTVDGNTIRFNGTALPSDINERILKLASLGEDPGPIFRFWEKLQKNPSFRSVESLWRFLQNKNIPLGKDGSILAYKSVDQKYMDHHTGTVKNEPGTTHEMPRNKISDDPRVECHYGYHVGAYEYASTFQVGSQRIIICKVDPADVVCVPYDYSSQKMRVCKYSVIGNYGAELPDTVFDVTDEPVNDIQEDDVADVPVVEEENHENRKPLWVPKKGFAKFHKLDSGGLLKLSIEDLRKYATYGMDIVGASKIPGGKVALVARIIEIREGK